MRRRIWAVLIGGGLVLGAAACERRSAESGGAGTMATASAPDTTAAALWAHLESASYRTAWATWPGKGRFYTGAEPHGMLLTTYVNRTALDAITGGATVMPAGAVIVKENYLPDSTLAAVTVMYKAPSGYDPPNRDWFWLKRNADGTVDMEGRGGMCATCHSAQVASDYVFTGALPGR